ncbi:conserved protein of unknown function (plasmid) [Rhodovastum atsumiense]|uniref:Uncharacterized protein n=1 Tax=Rhodovastum atsumiense TaxID=504468 RepID=A0A5M6IJ53_9PROT|nr:hypothetical protein [Rhodovastum atsumiense]KAA5608270.1 hypothetical protein F1189_29880 [Rhodovastum atsumiense]CAH2605687.1 conserved protein of unknown function [Rhodovastum atsumiense]
MPHPSAAGGSAFTSKERDLIRWEMGQRFGQYPGLVDGIYLRAWHSGPQKGQPKVPLAMQGMLDRRLVEIVPDRIGFKAVFTEAGIQALREMAQDRRALDPARYPRLRAELGFDDGAGAAVE